MEKNGTIDIPWPPTVPPDGPDPAGKKLEEKPRVETPEPDYSRGWLGNIWGWWRTRRENALIARIRELEAANILLQEEAWQQGLMLDRLSKHNQILNLSMVDVLRRMDAPPTPPIQPTQGRRVGGTN